MAEYCTAADLGRYGVNAAALADLATEEQITPKIQEQSDIIDGYLRAQFTLPLVTWGSDIRGCCAVMAAWEVVRVRGLRPGEDIEQNPLYIAYNQKLKWLAMVAAGTVTPEASDSSPATGGGASSAAQASIASNVQRGYHSSDPANALPFQGRRQ